MLGNGQVHQALRRNIYDIYIYMNVYIYMNIYIYIIGIGKALPFFDNIFRKPHLWAPQFKTRPHPTMRTLWPNIAAALGIVLLLESGCLPSGMSLSCALDYKAVCYL